MQTQGSELARPQTGSLTAKTDAQAIEVAPPVDIYENNDEILVVADLPGVPNDALSVRVDGGELLIEGTQRLSEPGPAVRPLAFSRAFRVPNTVDANAISAELTHGVLRVHLAKREAAKPRRIEVKAS